MICTSWDSCMGLHDEGSYSHHTAGESHWMDVSPQELQVFLESDSPPEFRTILARCGDEDAARYSGPLYLDFDHADIAVAIAAFHRMLDCLAALGVDLEMLRLFASGGKGFHIEVPMPCFMEEPEPVKDLPRVFLEMVLADLTDDSEKGTEGVDLRVYSQGQGRMWRVPNRERTNGKFKVPLSVDEARGVTPESYGELTAQPREFPQLKPAVLVPKLADAFSRAQATLAQSTPARSAAWTKAETEIRKRWGGDAPPCVRPLLKGDKTSREEGFNRIATQLAILAHALGWDSDRLVRECEGLCLNHPSDNRAHDRRWREGELIRLRHYVGRQSGYDFSVPALISILPSGADTSDLRGIAADAPEDGPDYASRLAGAGRDRSQIVQIAQEVHADQSLTETARAGFLKDAAKGAGVPLKVLQKDLYSPADGEGPFIHVHPADHAASVDSALDVLRLATDLRVRSGKLVEVQRGRLHEVSHDRLRYLLSKVAKWKHPGGIGSPDDAVVRGVAAAGHWPGVREIVGVAQQPTIIKDGSIGAADGFEPSFDESGFPQYAGTGREALEELNGLLDEFPFASELDRACAIAAILTAVARPALRTAPAFLVAAYEKGSGKTFLAELIGLFASADVPMRRWGRGSEEQSKFLLALLMEGLPLVVFDNLSSDWKSDTLAAILTNPTYGDRVLGASETVAVSTRCLFLATGNNIKAGVDLARRVVPINLDARVARPMGREFQSNPIAVVRADRGRWVMLALQVLQDFVVSGEKPQLFPLGSFGEWSELIRGAMVSYGLQDVVGAVITQVDDDDDRQELETVVWAWGEVFGPEPMTLKDALREVRGKSAGAEAVLLGAFEEIAGDRGELSLRKLGQWFKAHKGRVVEGKRLMPIAGASRRDGVVWALEAV